VVGSSDVAALPRRLSRRRAIAVVANPRRVADSDAPGPGNGVPHCRTPTARRGIRRPVLPAAANDLSPSVDSRFRHGHNAVSDHRLFGGVEQSMSADMVGALWE